MSRHNDLTGFLNKKVEQYNQPSFIKDDPVCIPHLFTQKQDIEIAGFFAATFAWGNRTTIINKSRSLMEMLDNAPYDFIKNHAPHHLEKLLAFRHRTFSATDLLYFMAFLQSHYSSHASLETAFFPHGQAAGYSAEQALTAFNVYFFSLEDVPQRTRKHIASPARHSTCKRLNMFLRWMVRNDHKGVDFGIWNAITPAQLICPCDVHVARVARRFQLLKRTQTDWQAAVELTDSLRQLDPADPVKYDFALFGLGVMEKF